MHSAKCQIQQSPTVFSVYRNFSKSVSFLPYDILQMNKYSLWFMDLIFFFMSALEKQSKPPVQHFQRRNRNEI